MTSGGTSGLRRALPVLALGLFGVSWSAVLVRLADAPAATVAFWRLVISVALIVPALAATGQAREVRRLGARDWLWVAAAGTFLAAHLIAWFLSLEYTSVASSTVLVTAHPLFVGLLSAAWLAEAPGREEWAGIGLAVAGAVLVGWGDLGGGPRPVLGDALALSGALLAALYFVVGRRLRPRLSLWSYVVPVYAVAALVTGLYLWIAGEAILGWSLPTWACFAALAVGPMLMGHTSFNWALGHVRAYVVSVVLLLEPIGATLLAVVVLGGEEVPGWTTAAGGAGVLLGVWLSLRARSRARRVGAGDPVGRVVDPAGRAGSVEAPEPDGREGKG